MSKLSIEFKLGIEPIFIEHEVFRLPLMIRKSLSFELA